MSVSRALYQTAPVTTPRIARWFIADPRSGWLWFAVRMYVGWEWFTAGRHKIWPAEGAKSWLESGDGLKAYWERQIVVPDKGRPPITFGWYREFLDYMYRHEWYEWFAPLVAMGEFLVGIALILGAFVGIAAFFGTFMNFNFMLAGSSSTNPLLFGIAVFIVLAWRTAGIIGLDHWLLPLVRTPWNWFRRSQSPRRVASAGSP